jgi:hypothetical protein
MSDGRLFFFGFLLGYIIAKLLPIIFNVLVI